MVERIKAAGINATKIFNPANGHENALMDKGAKDLLEKTVTTWDPVGYLVLLNES